MNAAEARRLAGRRIAQQLRPKKTADEVAKFFGISRASVRITEERALGKIAEAFKSIKL